MPFPVNAAERALTAVLDDAPMAGLLDELARARLWVPTGGDGGGAPELAAFEFDGMPFVAAYTSTEQVAAGTPGAECATVPGFRLARLLPEGCGIALNPGGQVQFPVYPEGVAVLAAAEVPPDAVPDSAEPAGDGVTVRSPSADTRPLREAVAALLPEVPEVAAAADGWAETSTGEVLVVAVTLDVPDDPEAQDAVIAAVEQAVGETGPDFAVDVVFPGAPDEDATDDAPGGALDANICGADDCCGGGCGAGVSVPNWIATNRPPFYVRP
ncbi:MAG TPA: SseB family protein [Streptosporangiaceae bacterium]|jgi:hypothetical protein